MRNGVIVRVNEKQQRPIQINDEIKTLPASEATIFWPEGSVTRLGEKTDITIDGLEYDTHMEDTSMNIHLNAGKTWTMIIRYLAGQGGFHEAVTGTNLVATVRGTTFEVNESDPEHAYIATEHHAITLTDTTNHTDYTVSE